MLPVHPQDTKFQGKLQKPIRTTNRAKGNKNPKIEKLFAYDFKSQYNWCYYNR